jgi:H/ACA ribonucleoprotein complex subunit 3
LLDATCAFGHERCWFLASIEGSKGVTNHCVLVARDGRVLGRHSAPEGDGSWLGTLRGKCAAGAALLCATDDGVTRVEEVAGTLAQTRIFPDTAPYVDSATHLFAGRDGLYAVTDRTIYLLRLGGGGNGAAAPPVSAGQRSTNPD